MKGKHLMEALNQVDERFLEEAEEPLKLPKSRGIFWISAAACLCLLVLGGMLLPGMNREEEQKTYPGGVQLSNETLAIEDPGDGATPTIAPANSYPVSPADGGERPGNAEQPSVILKITRWTDTGLDAVVDGLADTSLIPAGTEVKVIFSQNCCYATPAEDYGWRLIDEKPTEETYPAGSRILVQFYGYEDGYLYVDMVYPGGEA